MIDFICPVKIDDNKRVGLLRQTILSLLANTKEKNINNIIFVDDKSSIEWWQLIDCQKISVVMPYDRLGVGGAKNYGADLCNKIGRGKYLYMFDGDVYFTSGWDMILLDTYKAVNNKYKILAGGVHPFLQPRHGESMTLENICNLKKLEVTSHDALSGWSWLMDWDVWGTYGKLAFNAFGSGQSEDWEYCQRIRSNGFLVGCVQPQIIAHCGMTNTENKDIPGRAECEKLAKLVSPMAVLA